jgi:DNA replication protein DnaC
MATAFEDQFTNSSASELAFEDRFGMVVDAEWDSRKSSRLKRMIRAARYACPGAALEDVEYHADRHLNRDQISRLSTCAYVRDAHDVIIVGPTGSGKTFLTCALDMAANRLLMPVIYVRTPELLSELAIAHNMGEYDKTFKAYRKVKLLIIDEWLLYEFKDEECREMMELIDARHGHASTILCSQYATHEWHPRMGNNKAAADAILDRLTNTTYMITLSGDSMRKRKGFQDSND